jgi:hypothetical protein
MGELDAVSRNYPFCSLCLGQLPHAAKLAPRLSGRFEHRNLGTSAHAPGI